MLLEDRKGDPLSLFLSILAVEGLSKMIEKANLLHWLEALRLVMMLGTLSQFLICSMQMKHSYCVELREHM